MGEQDVGDQRSDHLSDEQLALFQDGELSPPGVGHLDACPECASRLRDLETAHAAYAEYRDLIRGPMLPPAPSPWRSLDKLIQRDELKAQAKARNRARAWRWWLIPGLATALCLLFAAV